MNIGELIKKKGVEVETVTVDTDLDSALDKMNNKHIGALMVFDQSGEIAGIVSERDFLNVCNKCGQAKNVSDLMTSADKLVTLSTKESLQDAMKKFTNNRVRHLPVIEDNKLLGIVSIGDAVKELLEAVEQENKYLNEYILGQNI